MEDGKITIGCELNTDDLEEDLKVLDKLISKEDDEKVEKKVEIIFDDKDKSPKEKLEEIDQKIQELQAHLEETKKVGQEMTMAWVQSGAPINETYQDLLAKSQEVENTEAEINDLTKQRAQAVKEVESAEKAAAAETTKAKKGFENLGQLLQNAVKKAGALVLGIFAIRGAINAMKRASSDLANYDKEYASNLEYIRYVLTEALAPALKWIVQLAATLLGYLFQILNAWFGLNLGKGAKDFEAMKKSSSGVASNMKEAEKAAQGFDELNTLQDNSKSSGGGGGYTAPSLDLSGMQGEPPAWLQWIIDNKDLVLGALTAILGAIIGIKTGIGGIAGMGIGLAIYGVVSLIGDLIDFIKDPSWEKFGKVLKDIGVAITGVGIAIGALTGNWLVAIIGLITTIVGLIIENWDDIQKTLSGVGQWIYDNVIKPVVDFFDNMGKWIYNNVILPVVNFFDNMFTNIGNFLKNLGTNIGNFFSGLWQGIVNVFSHVGEFFGNIFKGAFEAIKNVFSGIGNFFQGVWNGIVNVFSKIGQKIGDAVSGAFKGAVNAIFTVLENILNFPIRAINGLIGLVNMIPGVNLGKIQEFRLPRLKTGGIINLPNKGTMVGGSAIGGESGREGVIPLTDAQAMETLGESIGKYVTINATINNTMDGKLISRHIQKIQNQQAFAGNF